MADPEAHTRYLRQRSARDRGPVAEAWQQAYEAGFDNGRSVGADGPVTVGAHRLLAQLRSHLGAQKLPGGVVALDVVRPQLRVVEAVLWHLDDATSEW